MSTAAECFTTELLRTAVAEGYGIRITVDGGHLVVQDGIGRHRRERRYPKVGHGLDRLLILGHTGSVSLEAVRWLTKTGIPLLNIDTDGTVLAATTAIGRDDARLRRQQALALDQPVGLEIARALIGEKLTGQADVAARHLNALGAAALIDAQRFRAENAEAITDVVEAEAAGAVEYFGAWTGRVAVTWARRDDPKVPKHWRTFDGRRSMISKTAAIRATDPVNALLNYMYAMAEAECRLACQTMGLDPGLGIIHWDRPGRDSLALDLIETVRRDVDAYILDLLDGHVFRKADFAELDDGHCRILPPLTHHLAATLPRWREAVAPWAEHVAHILADASPANVSKPTPLTGSRRRVAAGKASSQRRRHPKRPVRSRAKSDVKLGTRCAECGGPVIHRKRSYCPECWPARQSDAGRRGSKVARAQLEDPEARLRRGAAISKGKAQAAGRRAAEHGFDPDFYERVLAAQVHELSLRGIQEATGLSQASASRIRRGVSTPSPEHWQRLLERCQHLT